jgi:hypothetical protein
MFEREILEMPGPILKKNLLEAQRLQRVGSDDSVVLSEFARDSPVLSKVDFSAVHAMAHRKLAQRRHTRGGKTKLVVSRNFAGQLETYYDSYTIPEMGEKLGIEETTLLKWMKEFGTKEIHGGIYSLCGLTFGQFLPDSWVRFPKGCIDTMDAKAKGEEITAYVAARRRGRGRGYPDIMGVIADVFPGEPDGNDMEMITAIRDGLLKIDRLEPKLSFMVAKAARDFTDRNLHHETAQDDPQGLPKPKSHKEEPQRLKIHLNNLFILAARIVDSGGESEDARKQQIQELLAKFNKETAGNIGVTP